MQAEASASIRCLDFESDPQAGICAVCGGRATETATWARAY